MFSERRNIKKRRRGNALVKRRRTRKARNLDKLGEWKVVPDRC